MNDRDNDTAYVLKASSQKVGCLIGVVATFPERDTCRTVSLPAQQWQ